MNTPQKQVNYLYSEGFHEGLIPVTWVKQFHYCPRIIYFIAVLGVNERTTESMIEGKEIHISEELKELRRKTLGGDRKVKVKQRWAKLKVASERLGIIGVIDQIVEIDGELALVEIKHGSQPRKPQKHHIYQAVAYAMLAEEAIGRPVRKIILKYIPSGEIFTQLITDHMRNHVKWTVRQIKKIMKEEEIPDTKPNKRCSGCGWKWICRQA